MKKTLTFSQAEKQAESEIGPYSHKTKDQLGKRILELLIEAHGEELGERIYDGGNSITCTWI